MVQIPYHIIPKTPAAIQAQEVQALIQRTVGDVLALKFNITIDKSLEFRSYEV